MDRFGFQELAQPMFEIGIQAEFLGLGSSLPLTQKIEYLKKELTQVKNQIPSIVLNPSDLERKEIKDLLKSLEKWRAEVYLLDEIGNVYNLRRCCLYNEKELPDELAKKLLSSPIFEYVEKLWKENELKSIEDELKHALREVILGNNEKIAEHFEKYFKKKGDSKN